MLERLGNVVFWLGCIVAAGFLALAALSALFTGPGEKVFLIGLFLALALAAYLFGLAVRYVLGREP